MRQRTSLFAALCALVSLDARADPYAQAFGAFFLAALAAWVVPAARLWWLKRSPLPPRR
jgi:hypothetical protein